MRNALRRNAKLAQAAREIFGNVVEQAYIVTWFTPETSEYKDSREAMFRELAEPVEVKGDSLHYDSRSIAIKFRKGNLVEFRNSEWASITKKDISDYEKV